MVRASTAQRACETTVGPRALQRGPAAGARLTSTRRWTRRRSRAWCGDCYSRARARGDGASCSTSSRTSASSYATRAGITVGIDDVRRPAREGRDHRAGAQTRSDADQRQLPRRRHHRRRALQQGHRHLDARHRPRSSRSRSRAWRSDRDGLQPDLHDGRLGRARYRGADPPARRHARPDGQAAEEDHRRRRRDHRVAGHRATSAKA